MKSPRKLSVSSQDEARRFNVLLEKMYSEFKVFGESLSDVRNRVGRIEIKLDARGEEIEIFKSAVRTNGQDINLLKDAVHSNTDAIRANTEAIHAMHFELKNMNHRLEVVEAKST